MRLILLKMKEKDCADRSVDVSDGFDPFLQLDSVKEIGFNQLNLTAKVDSGKRTCDHFLQ